MTGQKVYTLGWRTGCFLLLLMGWSYWPAITRIANAWISNPDYTHGIVVLPLAWLIAMRRRPMVADKEWTPSALGLTLVALAGIMRIAAARFYILELDTWSLPLWLAGMTWTLLGWHWFWALLPSLGFLCFAIPLPATVEQLLSLPLQQFASLTSAWILQCLGEPAVAAGTTLLMGSETFEVERACSGLRMFVGTFAMATAYCLLSASPWGIRGLILAMAAPVAIFTNIIRIVITAAASPWVDHRLTSWLVHDMTGLLMIGVACLIFMFIGRVAKRLQRTYESDRDQFFRRAPAIPVTLIVIGAVAVLWHHRQVTDVHETLLASALRFESEKNWGEASRYFQQYVQLKGDQPEVLSRLARSLKRSAQSHEAKRRALLAMTAAAKANPDDTELAFEQAAMAIELRQFPMAIEVTRKLLREEPADNLERHRQQLAVRWQANALYELVEADQGETPYTWGEVAETLRQASRLDSRYSQHAYRLAVVYRERLTTPTEPERYRLADEALNELVATNEDSADAHLARYLYRRRYHRQPNISPTDMAEIDADLERAIELTLESTEPNVHVLVAAAERMRERGEMDKSLDFYQRALRANSLDVRPYIALSEIWVEQDGDSGRQRAIEILQRGLQIIGTGEVTLSIPLLEHLIVQDRTEEADRLLESVEENLKRYPEPAQTSLRVQLEHVRAWRVAKGGDFLKAGQQLSLALQRLGPTLMRSAPTYLAQSWASVGQYYRMANDWSNASSAYEHAAALDEAWRLEYRWAKAHEAELSGNLRDTATRLEEVAAAAPDPFEAWMQVAAAEIRQQVQLSVPLRDWTNFRRAIEAARAVAGERADQVIVMEVNQGLAMGQSDRVLATLQEACAKMANSPILFRSLALLQLRRGDITEALDTAARLPVVDGDTTDMTLLRHEVLSQAGKMVEARQALEEGLASPQTKDRVAVLVELARMDMQEGKWQEARARLQDASREGPNDLRVTETLSQLAWALEDWDLLEQCEASLRVIEGVYGPRWRTFRIRRILAQSQESTTEGAKEAEEAERLTREMEKMFPHLQQTHITAGRVATHRGLLWKAVANYEEAWDLGLPRISLAVDLITLLNELGETDRAQRYVRETRQYLMTTEQFLDDSLMPMDAETAYEAIRMAEALVTEQPQSSAYLRLGRTLVLSALPGRPDTEQRLQRAEQAFREAIRIEPSDTRTWAALFRYLVSVRPNPIESQALLSELAAREDISLLNRKFVLAQLNESIGNTARAGSLYREAIELARKELPSEQLVVLERSAQFFHSSDPAFAETCCREALQLEENAVGPTQILLHLLLEKNGPEAAVEAERLVNQLAQHWGDSDYGKRIRAEVLMRVALQSEKRADTLRKEAIELLKSVNKFSSQDALLLSELHLTKDERAEAMVQLQYVAEQLPKDTAPVLRYLAAYGDTLYNDARFRLLGEQLFEKLEQLPESDLQSLDLRIELAKQRSGGSPAEKKTLATSMLSEFVRRRLSSEADAARQVDILARVMQHLVDTERGDQAMSLLPLIVDLVPAPRGELAMGLALARTEAKREQLQPLADKLHESLASFPGSAELRFAVANVALMQGQTELAIQLWRDCLLQQPDHLRSLNNLALALVCNSPGSSDESMTLLNRAIELGGRDPLTLDSLAVVHLVRNEPQAALELLLEALPSSKEDALMFLHLAAAWSRLGDSQMAEFALTMAESRQIGRRPLMPLDRQLLQELRGKLL